MPRDQDQGRATARDRQVREGRLREVPDSRDMVREQEGRRPETGVRDITRVLMDSHTDRERQEAPGGLRNREEVRQGPQEDTGRRQGGRPCSSHPGKKGRSV